VAAGLGEIAAHARGPPVIDVVTMEALADLIVEKLDERERSRQSWVTADVVASHLSVDIGYVYEHATELGAVRLGDGPKARLRFRLDLVDEAVGGTTACPAVRASNVPGSGTVEAKRRRRRPRLSGTGVPLLPVSGREGRP
jgi:hypothetical protein